MAPSIPNPPHRIRAKLQLRPVPVTIREIARKHGANEKTVHAALAGRRPGKDKRVRAAVTEVLRLAKGASL